MQGLNRQEEMAKGRLHISIQRKPFLLSIFSEPIDGDPTEPVNSRFRHENRPFRTFYSWNEKTDATIASWLCFHIIYSTGRKVIRLFDFARVVSSVEGREKVWNTNSSHEKTNFPGKEMLPSSYFLYSMRLFI
ncbi:hypothetical protein NitaMp024 (mitochondrion) [Nicotiana tabacum]|uniref:Uncharacterized protein n=1 Tax=Nicotiana tabacum TaxID=4097 RepID=Q5MA44_TOBAC|nr:hypothetical protein NitaMp024 [Nicotiana tabacum]BAD83434.1 hypothetical protein [Nicotiana tabacum]